MLKKINDFYIIVYIHQKFKNISELNKSEICILTLCLSREVTKKLIVTQSWYASIERFFQFHTLLFLEMGANLTGLFLFNFETTLCKNHFDTNLDTIHKAVIEILSFLMFCANFSNNSHLGIPNCKKYNGFIQETFWPKVGSISTNGSRDIVIFVFMLLLVTVPGGHLGYSICINIK